MIRQLCVLVVSMWALAACSTPAALPTPTAAPPLPIEPTPIGAPAAPAPTVAAAGEPLPGRLLFVKSGDIWLWQGNRGGQLTRHGQAGQPAFSPDGSRIVFVRYGESFSDLVLMAADGSESTPLTNNGSDLPLNGIERVYDVVWAFAPAFAPGGDEIAFASQFGPPFGSPATDHPLALYTIAPTGGERLLRYGDPAAHIGRITYTPDGTTLIFGLTPTGNGSARLLRYDRIAETVSQLRGAPEQSYDPAVSPDGAWVAFATRDGNRTDIFALSIDGERLVRLTNLGAARAPVFSPDGTRLAFLAIAPEGDSFDLWVADLLIGNDQALYAGEPRRLTRGLRIDAGSGLAWGP